MLFAETGTAAIMRCPVHVSQSETLRGVSHPEGKGHILACVVECWQNGTVRSQAQRGFAHGSPLMSSGWCSPTPLCPNTPAREDTRGLPVTQGQHLRPPGEIRPVPCCAHRVSLKCSRTRSSPVVSGRPRVTAAALSSTAETVWPPSREYLPCRPFQKKVRPRHPHTPN